MIIVDSSGWLQYLTDGPLADDYAKRLRQTASIITPAVVVYEVYKHAKRLRGEDGAIDAVAAMRKTRIVPLDEELALIAADLSMELKLPMADAIILSTARAFGAELVTSDGDFKDIADVTYLPLPEAK
jgi:predicted nucleic acid-binding protein